MLKLKAVFRETPWPHLYFEEVFDPAVYTQVADLFQGELLSQELTDALKERLGVTEDCTPTATFRRSIPGDYIAPQTGDAVMILIAYLPMDVSQQMLGTRLLKKEEDKFIAVKQIGFFPNSGLAFKVTEDSWHQLLPLPPGRTRDSILVEWR